MKKAQGDHRLLPAAARFQQTGERAITRPTALVRASITAFEQALGGRRGVVEALSAARTLSPELHRVFALLADPRFDTQPLADLCADARVTPGDLFATFGAAVRAMEETIAMATAVHALPQAIADVAKRTTEHETICEICHGLGEIVPKATKAQPNPSPMVCTPCQGEGVLKQNSSLEHQRLLFEYVGILKRPGVQVNTQINNTPAAPPPTRGPSLEQLQHAASALLWGRHDSATVDGELVDGDAAAPAAPPDEERSSDAGSDTDEP